jgi:cytochrome P450
MTISEIGAPEQSKGGYRFPPGTPRSLAWHAIGHRRLVNPIVHFQSLTDRYGDVAHYRLGPKHIIFIINNPEYIREILIVQHANFFKVRTQQRSKLLLGEGLITADGAAHRKQRRRI